MILVHNDVLADPVAYRAAVRALPFSTYETFQGIATGLNDALETWIRRTYPSLVPTLTFARHSPYGQREPNDIHTDVNMGYWTAILYLTDPPDPRDGTLFWRNGAGAVSGVAFEDGHDRSRWECWHRVQARFNRLVLFPASYFHSRAIVENYGPPDDGRLIQVVFGTLKESVWQ